MMPNFIFFILLLNLTLLVGVYGITSVGNSMWDNEKPKKMKVYTFVL